MRASLRSMVETISRSASSASPGFVESEAGDVPTRMVEPRDDAAGDRVTHAREDDRDGPRLPLKGRGRCGHACQDEGKGTLAVRHPRSAERRLRLLERVSHAAQ